MSRYQSIKAITDAFIKANGRREITGPILNSVLNGTIDSLGKYYQLVGVAVPTTDPGIPDENVAYIAGTAGTYAYMNNIQVASGEIAVIKFDGLWQKETIYNVPTNVSGLNNDVGYITNAVADLLNYYTKTEMDNALAGKQDTLVINNDDLELDPENGLQFINRENGVNTNGMGYVILRKDKTFAEQVTKMDTIYEIRYDYDLDGASVTIPAGCILRFNGGVLSNGTLTGNNTVVKGDPVLLFSQITFSGTWRCSSYCEWVGGDLKKAVETFGGVSLLENTDYILDETIVFPFGGEIRGFASSIIKATSNVEVMFDLGYHCTLVGFTVSCLRTGPTVVNIQTENMTRTYNNRNTRSDGGPAGNASIIIDGVRFRGWQSSDVNNGYFERDCITLKSDGYCSGGVTPHQGFWGVEITNCLIAGPWVNGIVLDSGSNALNNSIDPWISGIMISNVTASNLKDGFLLSTKRNLGYAGTLGVSSTIVNSCQLQYSGSMQYFAKCEHSTITLDNVIAWDFTNVTEFKINQDNSFVTIVNYNNFQKDYWKTIELIGTSTTQPGFEMEHGNICSGNMATYFLGDLGNNDTIKAGNIFRLPNGRIFLPLRAINYKQLKLDAILNYGTSPDYTEALIEKREMYGYYDVTLIAFSESKSCSAMLYMRVKNSLAATADTPSWQIIPGLVQFTYKSDFTNSNNGIGTLYLVNYKTAFRPQNWLTVDALGHEFTDTQFVSDPSGVPTFAQANNNRNGGKMLLNKASNRVAVYNNTTQKWYEDGAVIGVARSGATTARPSHSDVYVGFEFFDTTLGKPVYSTGSDWVDATGASV